MYATPMNDEEMLTMIKECAEKLGRTPTTGELERMTNFKLNKRKLTRRFGSYVAAVEACGLRPSRWTRSTPILEVFVAWATAVRRLGALPTMAQYEALSRRSCQPITRRAKRWPAVPQLMMKIMQEHDVAKDWEDVAAMVQAHEKMGGAMTCNEPRTMTCSAPRSGTHGPHGMGHVPFHERWSGALMEDPDPMENEPIYGEPILHPAMAHAPTNESALAILFGAMAVELGFKILRAQQPCPDVVAMRRVNGGWQLVRIELEFESINFLKHMHDRKDCDLIVCWKHNWKDCPVPVIELSKLLAA